MNTPINKVIERNIMVDIGKKIDEYAQNIMLNCVLKKERPVAA